MRVSLAALQRALRRHYPGWSLPPLAAYDADVRENYERERKPEVPFACCGDFDGNGLPDVALILKKRRSRWLVVAFHQTYRGTFRSYRLDQWRGRGDVDGHVQMTIERMPRGPVTYLTGGPNMATATMRIEHDGIFESNEEGFGMTYYFKGGRHYRSVDTGD